MNKTGIEYLTHTWNPMHGCSPISPGCKNCWANGMAKRLAGIGANGYDPSDPFKVTLHHERLAEPLAVKKPSRIGVSFMGDLFHDDVPFEFMDKVFAVMALAPQHTYLVLTKRPERMAEYFADECRWAMIEGAAQAMHHDRTGEDPSLWLAVHELPNLWLGVTVENQEQSDKRIPLLLQIPAAKRFVSVEPMLGPITLNYSQASEEFYSDFLRGCKNTPLSGEFGGDEYHSDLPSALDWVVCGGESGPDPRPCHPDWVRSLRDQCMASGVPFMFKQWGEFLPGAEFLKPYVLVDLQGNVYEPGQVPAVNHGRLAAMQRVGKKAAGHLIDEYEEHMEMPAW